MSCHVDEGTVASVTQGSAKAIVNYSQLQLVCERWSFCQISDVSKFLTLRVPKQSMNYLFLKTASLDDPQ